MAKKKKKTKKSKEEAQEWLLNNMQLTPTRLSSIDRIVSTVDQYSAVKPAEPPPDTTKIKQARALYRALREEVQSLEKSTDTEWCDFVVHLRNFVWQALKEESVKLLAEESKRGNAMV